MTVAGSMPEVGQHDPGGVPPGPSGHRSARVRGGAGLVDPLDGQPVRRPADEHLARGQPELPAVAGAADVVPVPPLEVDRRLAPHREHVLRPQPGHPLRRPLDDLRGEAVALAVPRALCQVARGERQQLRHPLPGRRAVGVDDGRADDEHPRIDRVRLAAREGVELGVQAGRRADAAGDRGDRAGARRVGEVRVGGQVDGEQGEAGLPAVGGRAELGGRLGAVEHPGQLGDVRRRQHRPAGLPVLPVGGDDAGRAAVADQHPLDRPADVHPAAVGLDRGHQRVGQRARAAHRRGPAERRAPRGDREGQDAGARRGGRR